MLRTYPLPSRVGGHVSSSSQMFGSPPTCRTPRMDLPKRDPNKRSIRQKTGRMYLSQNKIWFRVGLACRSIVRLASDRDSPRYRDSSS